MFCSHLKVHFSKQKGYLDEELDFRKQSMDQAHKVRPFSQHFSYFCAVDLSYSQNYAFF